MTPVCPHCRHLMPEGTAHACPSAAYAAARDRLVADAATAVEYGLVPEECDIPGREGLPCQHRP